MKRFLPVLVLALSSTAFAVPGAKRSLGTIRPKPKAEDKVEATKSLGESYALVGTISCDSCASPFQPVAVIRELSGQRLLHLRVGDDLALSGGDRAVVTVIGSGAVDFKSAQGAYRLRAGGFPDEAADDSTMIAKNPKTYMPPPPNGVRW